MSARSALREFLREAVTADLRSLACMRVLTGAGLVFDVLYRARDLEAHYTDAGVLPTETARALVRHFGWFSVHTLSGSFTYQLFLSILSLLLALSLTVGFATRIVTPLSWLLCVSAQNRFFLGDYPGDYVLTMLLLSGALLPWGAWFSVDAWRRRRGGAAMPAPRYRGLGAVTFFFLFTVFLGKTGISKIAAGGCWLDGTALFITLSAERYTSHWLDGWLDHLLLLKAVSYAVPWLELTLAAAFFFPLRNGVVRTAAIAVTCVLFGSFSVGLDLLELPYLAAVAYVGFLPPWCWDRLVPKLSTRLSSGAPASSEAVSRDVDLAPSRAFALVNGALAVFFLVLHATHYYYKIGNFGYFSSPKSPPAVVDRAMDFLKIKNIYRMFSDPNVFEQSDGWDVAPGELANGREINAFTGGDLSFAQPESLIASLGSFRWRQHLTLMNWYPTWNPKNITSYHVVEYSTLRSDLARFLCRRWNAQHRGAERLVSVDLAMVVAPARYAQPKPPYRVVELLDHAYRCEEPLRGQVGADHAH